MWVADPETRAGIAEYHAGRARINAALERMRAKAAVSGYEGYRNSPLRNPATTPDASPDTSKDFSGAPDHTPDGAASSPSCDRK
jgi:hypothetical protein